MMKKRVVEDVKTNLGHDGEARHLKGPELQMSKKFKMPLTSAQSTSIAPTNVDL
jgi:hypothetical protein